MVTERWRRRRRVEANREWESGILYRVQSTDYHAFQSCSLTFDILPLLLSHHGTGPVVESRTSWVGSIIPSCPSQEMPVVPSVTLERRLTSLGLGLDPLCIDKKMMIKQFRHASLFETALRKL